MSFNINNINNDLILIDQCIDGISKAKSAKEVVKHLTLGNKTIKQLLSNKDIDKSNKDLLNAKRVVVNKSASDKMAQLAQKHFPASKGNNTNAKPVTNNNNPPAPPSPPSAPKQTSNSNNNNNPPPLPKQNYKKKVVDPQNRPLPPIPTQTSNSNSSNNPPPLPKRDYFIEKDDSPLNRPLPPIPIEEDR